MKKIAFVLALLGLFTLLILAFSLPPKKLSSKEHLSDFQPNQKLIIEGKVIKETYNKNQKVLHLDNNLNLQCPNPCPSLLNKNIKAIIRLESYNNKYYLKILKLNYDN